MAIQPIIAVLYLVVTSATTLAAVLYRVNKLRDERPDGPQMTADDMFVLLMSREVSNFAVLAGIFWPITIIYMFCRMLLAVIRDIYATAWS